MKVAGVLFLFPPEVLYLALMFMPVIHFDLIFAYGVKRLRFVFFPPYKKFPVIPASFIERTAFPVE